MAEGLKDRELQSYYEEQQATFSTKGWALLVDDLQKMHDAADNLDGIDSMEDLHFRRGQIDALKRIIARPKWMAAAYELLLGQEDD